MPALLAVALWCVDDAVVDILAVAAEEGDVVSRWSVAGDPR